ncbi:sensor histidine kinase [Modestobacter sp. SSW1-42]|uniref:sensor histidine kinase n=1 Tax=Modestobacter sp. SSW1-42 TaxID=596372 RepID=UPI00398847D6
MSAPPVRPTPARQSRGLPALLHRADPWTLAATGLVALALVAGLASILKYGAGDRDELIAVLALGVVGLLTAVRDNWLTPVVAAVLVAAEVRDPAPSATWAVAGGLLLLFSLRRPRLDAVAAGVVFAVAAALADLPWTDGVLGGGPFGLMTLAAAAVGIGQWVQAQRRYMAAELGRRQEEAERRRQEVTRHVAEERLRISRDLHDSVAHHFAVVSIQTNLARAQLAVSPPAADRALQDVQAAARSALEELQLLLGVLREEPDAALPDVEAEDVDDLVASYRRTGLDVESAGTEVFALLPAPARAGVYRVLQEALTNAHRYGDGSASATFTRDGGDVVLTVRNAIAPSAVAIGGGRGLTGMRERVADLGGQVQAGARDGEFVVVARVPVAVPELTGQATRSASGD